MGWLFCSLTSVRTGFLGVCIGRSSLGVAVSTLGVKSLVESLVGSALGAMYSVLTVTASSNTSSPMPAEQDEEIALFVLHPRKSIPFTLMPAEGQRSFESVFK